MPQHAIAPELTVSSALTDYGSALIHLVWAVHRHSHERTWVCGAVELLPHEVPSAPSSAECNTDISRRYQLRSRRISANVQDALRWFEDVAAGCIHVPHRDSSKLGESETNRASAILFAPLPPEPSNTSMITARTRTPFAPDWAYAARTRHILATTDPLATWQPREREQAHDLLRGVHVDLTSFEEYFGSTHLIAPNPVFRELNEHVDRSDPARPKLVFSFILRSASTLDGLILLVEEKRPTGVVLLAAVAVNSTIVTVSLSHPPIFLRRRVLDLNRGVIYETPFLRYLTGAAITMSTSTFHRQVSVPNSDDNYVVPVSEQETSFTVGHTTDGSTVTHSRLTTAAAARKLAARGTRDQRWFPGKSANAPARLRELVRDARIELTLCDPYFSAEDIHRLLLALKNPRVPIRVLASRAHLSRVRAKSKPKTFERELLRQTLEELRGRPGPSNPMELRVMPGKEPPIHDRFLVIDGTLWTMGSSLNNFGKRGTLVVRVPNGAPILAELERLWSSANSLDAFLQNASHANA